jgi:hypothetical protein
LLFIVNPFYSLLNLCGSFIFTIVFSDSGIPVSQDTEYRTALLASNVLIQLFYIATASALLFMSMRNADWNVLASDGTPGNVPLCRLPFFRMY